jgi:hypothetical protein
VHCFAVALLAVALAAAATPSPGRAEHGPLGNARWMRTMGAPPEGAPLGTVFELLDDGNVLVRSGRAVAAVDSHSGVTRWSFSAISGASLSKAAVVLRRSNVVFAVRARGGAAPIRLFEDGAEVAEALGSAAFVTLGTGNGLNELVIDRPSPRGGFVTRRLGRVRGPIAAASDDSHYGVAVRVGDRVAAAGDGLVTLYDEFACAQFVAQNPCSGSRHVLASHAALFILCDPRAAGPPILTAYSLP